MEGLFSLLLFAGLFFLMMRFGCGAHVMHGGHNHQHAERNSRDIPMGMFYACPMHPEIRQTYPGKCPKCGMTLEKSIENRGEQS